MPKSRISSLILAQCMFFVCYFAVAEKAMSSQRGTIATQRPYIINNRTYYPLPSAEGYEETGIASWYGGKFHGRRTSNGETYNMHNVSAAHKLLPMHTMLLVQNLENGKEAIVRVNDRGPFVQGRIIDLSYGAAQQLDVVHSGTAKVKITALGEGTRYKNQKKIAFKKHADLRSGEYYVQIGAFREKYNAISLQERFATAGHKTVIHKRDVNGESFFKVQIYVGQTLNNARRREKALLEKGYRGAFIIARR